jgi:starch synthase
VHAHDWHAGLAPAYIAQNPALNTATVFTIHNLAFRGLFPLDHHNDLGLLISGADQSALEFHGQLSFMKAALVHAKRVNTVSPTYAREICTPEFGWGLDGLLRDRGGDIFPAFSMGSIIQSGIRVPTRALPRTYTADHLRGKKVCKLKLQAEMGFARRRQGAPVRGGQSADLAKGDGSGSGRSACAAAAGGQLVVIGSGEADIEAGFRAAAAASSRCRVRPSGLR